MEKAAKTQYVNLYFFEMLADKFYKLADLKTRGLLLTLWLEIYAAGGRIEYNPDEIQKLSNQTDDNPEQFKIFLDIVLKANFQKRGRYIKQKRCTSELKKAQTARHKKVMAGKAGAAVKATLKQRSSDAKAPPAIRNETKERERERDETKRIDLSFQQLQLYDALAENLGPIRTKSDQTTLRRISKYILESYPWSSENLIELSASCKGPGIKNPISLFNSKVKEVYNWKPANAVYNP
tara:strand:+ start:277 stop:987 length:711 start_codon:yes stop_codon:yes gene_type:complete